METRSPYCLELTLVEARHLPKKDVLGWCDPFVALAVGGNRVRSTVKNSTSAPKWHETWRLPLLLAGGVELSMDVFDWDRWSQDDLVGRATVPVPTEGAEQAEGAAAEGWFALQHPDTGEPMAAEVFVRMRVVPQLRIAVRVPEVGDSETAEELESRWGEISACPFASDDAEKERARELWAHILKLADDDAVDMNRYTAWRLFEMLRSETADLHVLRDVAMDVSVTGKPAGTPYSTAPRAFSAPAAAGEAPSPSKKHHKKTHRLTLTLRDGSALQLATDEAFDYFQWAHTLRRCVHVGGDPEVYCAERVSGWLQADGHKTFFELRDGELQRYHGDSDDGTEVPLRGARLELPEEAAVPAPANHVLSVTVERGADLASSSTARQAAASVPFQVAVEFGGLRQATAVRRGEQVEWGDELTFPLKYTDDEHVATVTLLSGRESVASAGVFLHDVPHSGEPVTLEPRVGAATVTLRVARVPVWSDSVEWPAEHLEPSAREPLPARVLVVRDGLLLRRAVAAAVPGDALGSAELAEEDGAAGGDAAQGGGGHHRRKLSLSTRRRRASAAAAAAPSSAETPVGGTTYEEVFENERYQPFRGFGSTYPGHLLPTDRGRYSSNCGDWYRTELDCQPPEGWQWEAAWELDLSYTDCDPDGWSYGLDFPYLEADLARHKSNARCHKMRHYVRRRKWQRLRRRVFASSAPAPADAGEAKAEDQPTSARKLFRSATLSLVDEVFENQRYSPLTADAWGSSFPGHLMPTDRPRLSDRNGAPVPVADVAEADGWVLDRSYTQCDEDGWSYAGDFVWFAKHLAEGKSYASPGLSGFVRRRRWVRPRRGCDAPPADDADDDVLLRFADIAGLETLSPTVLSLQLHDQSYVVVRPCPAEALLSVIEERGALQPFRQQLADFKTEPDAARRLRIGSQAVTNLGVAYSLRLKVERKARKAQNAEMLTRVQHARIRLKAYLSEVLHAGLAPPWLDASSHDLHEQLAARFEGVDSVDRALAVSSELVADLLAKCTEVKLAQARGWDRLQQPLEQHINAYLLTVVSEVGRWMFPHEQMLRLSQGECLKLLEWFVCQDRLITQNVVTLLGHDGVSLEPAPLLRDLLSISSVVDMYAMRIVDDMTALTNNAIEQARTARRVVPAGDGSGALQTTDVDDLVGVLKQYLTLVEEHHLLSAVQGRVLAAIAGSFAQFCRSQEAQLREENPPASGGAGETEETDDDDDEKLRYLCAIANNGQRILEEHVEPLHEQYEDVLEECNEAERFETVRDVVLSPSKLALALIVDEVLGDAQSELARLLTPEWADGEPVMARVCATVADYAGDLGQWLAEYPRVKLAGLLAARIMTAYLERVRDADAAVLGAGAETMRADIAALAETLEAQCQLLGAERRLRPLSDALGLVTGDVAPADFVARHGQRTVRADATARACVECVLAKRGAQLPADALPPPPPGLSHVVGDSPVEVAFAPVVAAAAAEAAAAAAAAAAAGLEAPAEERVRRPSTAAWGSSGSSGEGGEGGEAGEGAQQLQLIVQVMDAAGLHSDRHVGRIKTYVTVEVDGTKFKTRRVANTLFPEFNQDFCFGLANLYGTLRCQVRDKSMLSSSLMGWVNVPVASLTVNKSVDQQYPLEGGEGTIRLVLTVMDLNA